MKDKIKGCFLGLAIGDALGVPVEFQKREHLKNNPVSSMIGYGTWGMPAGTFSDDTSMALCTAESLLQGYDLKKIADSFIRFMNNAHWTASGVVFDIGRTTRIAIERVIDGVDPITSGKSDYGSNGNGSLMRIIPASIYFHKEDDKILYERIKEVSGITHRHFVSVFSCFIFSKLVAKVIQGDQLLVAYQNTVREVKEFVAHEKIDLVGNPDFERVLEGNIHRLPEDQLQSSGFVIDTLEASIWCLLNTKSFDQAVLKAVNLGGDTDTTACVTGGVAGLYYGVNNIPGDWRSSVARNKDILQLASEFVSAII